MTLMDGVLNYKWMALAHMEVYLKYANVSETMVFYTSIFREVSVDKLPIWLHRHSLDLYFGEARNPSARNKKDTRLNHPVLKERWSQSGRGQGKYAITMNSQHRQCVLNPLFFQWLVYRKHIELTLWEGVYHSLMDSLQKGPVMRKTFPSHDVIIDSYLPSTVLPLSVMGFAAMGILFDSCIL